jgi:hypothetical protein
MPALLSLGDASPVLITSKRRCGGSMAPETRSERITLERIEEIRTHLKLWSFREPTYEERIIKDLVNEVDALCQDLRDREETPLFQAWGAFRREIRQALHEKGIRSNPGWSDQNVIDAIRSLLPPLNPEEVGTAIYGLERLIRNHEIDGDVQANAEKTIEKLRSLT